MKAIHDMKRQMQQLVARVLSVRTLLALMLVAVIGVACLGGAAYADSVGLSRFTDNKDGSMTDTYSPNKLQWMKNANPCGRVLWNDAFTCVNNLGGGWQVPTIQQLYSLCNTQGATTVTVAYDGYCNDQPVDVESLLTGAGFLNVQRNGYWSSTPYDPYDDDTSYVWSIGMDNGSVFGHRGTYYVWPVRDASAPTPTCSYTLNPTTQNFSANGGTDGVNVTTTAGCKWTATSNNVDWLKVTAGGSGNGNGAVGYSVAANTGSQRTGTITIADKTFTVKQEGKATPAQVKLTVTKQGTTFDSVTASTGPISWSGTTTIASYGSGGCTGPGCTVTQTGTAYYSSGTPVTLKAREVSGSKFTGWGGDCTTAGQNPTCTINMSGNKNVTATFTASLMSSAQIVGKVYSKVTPQSAWTPSKATVTLKTVDGTLLQTYTTKDDGYYTFNGLSTGTYSILARYNKKGAWETVTISNPTTGGGSTIGTNTLQTRDLRMTDVGKPLIFVPGILGSSANGRSEQQFGVVFDEVASILPAKKCTQDQLEIFDPTVNALHLTTNRPVAFREFKELFEFEKNGFRVYEVPYDWRISLDDKATCPGGKKPWEYYLKPVIDKAKKATGFEKVYVVAHSMGGLLTRTYIQDEKYANDIEKFVMLGTPNEGSANAYFQWEGGDPLKGDRLTTHGIKYPLLPNVYDNSTRANCNEMTKKSCEKYDNTAIKKFTRENIEALGNLFPTYAFLKVWDHCDGELYCKMDSEPHVTPVPTTSPAYNKFLNDLNSDTNKNRMSKTKTDCMPGYSTRYCVPTKLFMTSNQTTASYINVKHIRGTDEELYYDGWPTKISIYIREPKMHHHDEDELVSKDIGDGTVVADTAIEPFKDTKGVPFIEYDKGDFNTHAGMLASEDLQEKVFTYLTGGNLTRPPKYAKRDTEPTTTLGFYLTGGVQPYMTDPQKRTEGVNFTTNQVEENIPDTTLNLGDGLSSIFINNPVNGTYTVDLKGNAGLFTVDAASFNLSKGSRVKTTKKGFYRNGTFNLSLTLDTNANVLTITSKVAPPTDVKAQNNGGKTRLTWIPSATADVIGYNIYGKTFDQEDFTLIASTGNDTTSLDTDNDWASTDTATVWYYVVTAFDADVTESLWDTTAENTNPINADFKASSTTVAVNTPVTFSDLSTGNITSWQWDFENDGVIDSTSQNPTHTYTAPGTYSVNLYVKDSDGKTDYDSKGAYIKVTSATSAGHALGSKVDLNGDGKIDVLWRNTTTGDIFAWQMHGTTIISGGYLTNAVPNNWQIIAIGDLNGDAKSDIVWRNTTNGDVAAWLMDGTTITGSGYMANAVSGNWQMAAIGDLNGDGKNDIVWQDTSTGDVFVWLMDGTTIISSGYMAKGMTSNWQMAAIGDLNGDGKSDIVWRDTTTGDIAAWLIDATRFINEAIVNGAYLSKGIPSNWKIAAMGDLNGDGSSDVVWQNTTTGDIAAWLMNGTMISSGNYLAKGIPNEWQITAIGDLSGDKKSDVVWQNTSNGDVAAWLMDATTISSGNYLSKGIPNNWQIQ
ncbi:MAG: VCBS repeat-containing protein [Magnetococcales bacterium]|nr:VCBS repeat-containing protein [Nitrospirota bacterium]